MKKAKLSLALVAGLVSTIGLSSCNEVTKKAGTVLTFEDANGTSVSLKADELFEDAQKSTTAKSTSFDKVYELLIRKYYASNSTVLKTIKNKASISVNEDMKTAANNAESGTSTYSEELEKILSSHGVETIDEDFEYWIYQHEKELFESNFYKEHINDLRDSGFSGTALSSHTSQKDWLNEDASANLKAALKDEGYLKEKMPYHVRHILRKVSAANGELTQAKITATEASKIAEVITSLAAGNKSFGEIAQLLSEDTSNTSYGDLGKMDLDESYVNEFKLGVYAYDTLYRTANSYHANEDANAKAKLAPVSDRTIKVNGVDTEVDDYFAAKGIGTIPFGAAIALAKTAELDSSNLGYKINEDNETFLPRNIIFNKYFNKHNVCVITPNEIEYNKETDSNNQPIESWGRKYQEGGENVPGTGLAVNPYNEIGEVKEDYNNNPTEYPGFKTTPYLDQKCLCDTTGNPVLVVRAGSSGSYEGIHFIVVERSALDDVANTANGNTTLSEYWSTTTPEAGSNKITYVNFLTQDENGYKERAEKVKGWVKGYNTNINSYIFAWLVNEDNITFKDATFEKELKTYIQNKIESSDNTAKKNRSDTWKTYAEFLVHQDEIRKVGKDDGTGELISETCAIGYLSNDAKEGKGLWAKGGACYGK